MPVLVWCFSGVAGFAVIQAFQPTLVPVDTIAFLSMAALLGAASGAVFALVVVGAAGGLGGFVPPLIMGWVYGSEGSYAIGLMLLSDIALAAAVYTGVKMSGLARKPEPAAVPPVKKTAAKRLGRAAGATSGRR
ncbi:hypothetical protein GCM10009682_31670 [Luedemannella flava]|uniref:Uncharacterized protein n=1 Tax=Luedemannella flava TaxID=349316 RepID=A0ABP4YCD3_9ACTN